MRKREVIQLVALGVAVIGFVCAMIAYFEEKNKSPIDKIGEMLEEKVDTNKIRDFKDQLGNTKVAELFQR